jgi:hypothetical protein
MTISEASWPWSLIPIRYDFPVVAETDPSSWHGLLVALGVHPRVAMCILRHSKIDLTMEIYSEAPADATQDALRKLGDVLT